MSEECLMSGDQNVRKCQQAGKDIVLYDSVRNILEEQIALFFINIQSCRSDLAGLHGFSELAGTALVLVRI